MGRERYTRRTGLFGAISVGSATRIREIRQATASVNPGSIAAVTRLGVNVTVAGAAVGDIVIMNPPDGLDDDLIFAGARVNAVNTVRLYLYNPTGGAIDDGALTWTYMLFRVA